MPILTIMETPTSFFLTNEFHDSDELLLLSIRVLQKMNTRLKTRSKSLDTCHKLVEFFKN